MSSLPHHRPQYLHLGPLEQEILGLLWEMEVATVKELHDVILADPDRELAYSSVTTILNRLKQKGWVVCEKTDRAYQWRSRISRHEAEKLWAHDQLQRFLAVGNPDLIAAFADSLDSESLDKLEAIAQRLRTIRQSRRSDQCT